MIVVEAGFVFVAVRFLSQCLLCPRGAQAYGFRYQIVNGLEVADPPPLGATGRLVLFVVGLVHSLLKSVFDKFSTFKVFAT